MEDYKWVFFSHYGNGDLYTAREFVKEIMQENPEWDFYFAHAKDPFLLSDIKGLRFTELDKNCNMRASATVETGGFKRTIYFNTWIGYAWGKYVEGIATCTLDNFRRMYNDTLQQLGANFQLNRHAYFYIPEIDYSIINPDILLRFISIVSDIRDKVLISNGDVQSGQAENFDFTPVIKRMCEDYPEKMFIVTEEVPLSYTNLYSTKQLIQKESGSDLIEISYLSRFCNTIIGRSSGPYVYCQTKENYDNPHKKFLSFTYESKAAHMANFEVPARRFWNNRLDYNLIRKVIDE